MTRISFSPPTVQRSPDVSNFKDSQVFDALTQTSLKEIFSYLVSYLCFLCLSVLCYACQPGKLLFFPTKHDEISPSLKLP